ncbi:cuticular protein-like protein, partial [Euroglyphus maynei]
VPVAGPVFAELPQPSLAVVAPIPRRPTFSGPAASLPVPAPAQTPVFAELPQPNAAVASPVQRRPTFSGPAAPLSVPAPARAPVFGGTKQPRPSAAVASPVQRRPTPSGPAAPLPVPSPARAPAFAGTKLPRPSAAVAGPVPRRPTPSRPESSSSAVAGPVRDRDNEGDDGGPHPAPEPYSFSFAVNDEESGAQLTREERQDAGGNIVGFYHILDAEGRRRRVDYTAGPEGFKATISSNEEGLVNRNSADADFTVEEVSEDRQNAVAAAYQAAARGRPQA